MTTKKQEIVKRLVANAQTADGLDVNAFADLIIQECIWALILQDIADPRDTVELRCAKKIKAHFGEE
jgi:hypothetical protein